MKRKKGDALGISFFVSRNLLVEVEGHFDIHFHRHSAAVFF
jgi:hypothetical protein